MRVVLVIAALAGFGFSGVAFAATTTSTAKNVTMSAGGMVVAQSTTNQGVRDWGQGSGRDGAGQGKGQGKKGQ